MVITVSIVASAIASSPAPTSPGVGPSGFGGIGTSADATTLPISVGKVEVMELGTSAANIKTQVVAEGTQYPQVMINSSAPDVAFGFNNLNPGAHQWSINSGGSGSALGPGTLVLWDGTLGLPKLAIATSGYIGINTVNPIGTFDMHDKAPVVRMLATDPTDGETWLTMDNDKQNMGFAMGSPFEKGNPYLLWNLDAPIGTAKVNLMYLSGSGDLQVTRSVGPMPVSSRPFACDYGHQGLMSWADNSHYLCVCGEDSSSNPTWVQVSAPTKACAF